MAEIKLKNTANTEFSISHNGTRGAKAVTSDQIVVAVETINDFPANPETGDTVIVKDMNRGGTFIYDATQSAVNNGVTVFDGWVLKDDKGAELILDSRYENQDITPYILEAHSSGSAVILDSSLKNCLMSECALSGSLYSLGDKVTVTLTGNISINQQKRLKLGGFNIKANGHTITIGSVWETEWRELRVIPKNAGDEVVIFSGGEGGTNFGCQGNDFKMFIENGGVAVNLNEYCNANNFDITIFGTDSYLNIYAGGDCEGNKWTGIFQSCSYIKNQHSDAQVVTGYIEDCNLSGKWIIDNAVVNGAADMRTRADKIKLEKRVSTGYSLGSSDSTSYLPMSDQFFGVTHYDERWMVAPNPNHVNIVADVDNVSITGLVFKRAAGAGVYGSHLIIPAGAVDDLIKAHGAVTVSFDAKNYNNVSGVVEVGSNSYLYPSVNNAEWQRYSYTLTKIGSYFRVYVSDASAGEIRFCNVSVVGGTVSKPASLQQFPLLDDGGSTIIPEIGGGIVVTTPNGTKQYKISVDNSGNLVTTLY